MVSSSTIPLLRFRSFCLDLFLLELSFQFYRHDLLRLFSNFLRSADFRLLHYDGQAGGSRTLRYGFPLFTSFEIGAGGPFDPQRFGLG